jgi:hypothetical protein
MINHLEFWLGLVLLGFCIWKSQCIRDSFQNYLAIKESLTKARRRDQLNLGTSQIVRLGQVPEGQPFCFLLETTIKETDQNMTRTVNNNRITHISSFNMDYLFQIDNWAIGVTAWPHATRNNDIFYGLVEGNPWVVLLDKRALYECVGEI